MPPNRLAQFCLGYLKIFQIVGARSPDYQLIHEGHPYEAVYLSKWAPKLIGVINTLISHEYSDVGSYDVTLQITVQTCTHTRTREALVSALPQNPGFVRGQVAGNANLGITDALVILGYLFLDAAAPNCLSAADANDDGQVSLNDPLVILNYAFTGGVPPASEPPRTDRREQCRCLAAQLPS